MTQAQRLNSYTVSTDYAPYVSIASTGTQLTSVVGDQGWQTFAMPFDFAFGENLIAQGTEVLTGIETVSGGIAEGASLARRGSKARR